MAQFTHILASLFYLSCVPTTNPVSISFSLESSGRGGEESRFEKAAVPWACMSVPLATGPLGREVREWDGEDEGGGGGGVEDGYEGSCNRKREMSH